jgi:DNA invertase Pin-like site-specific DNA recombinase
MTEPKQIRCALYARVSTEGQQSVPAQLEALREYAQRRGWTIAQEVAEVGSGAKTRPKREALMREARARTIDAIVVVKLDRWGRSLADLVATMQELADLDVSFVSVRDSIDMSTAAGRAMVALLCVFAAFERDLIIERVNSGMKYARKHGTASGKAIGRPSVAAARAVEVRALYAKGLSRPQIAEQTGLGYGSVQRLLTGVPRKGK